MTKASKKRWVEKQKKFGLCTSCSNPVEKGYAKCGYHRTWTKKVWKKYPYRKSI